MLSHTEPNVSSRPLLTGTTTGTLRTVLLLYYPILYVLPRLFPPRKLQEENLPTMGDMDMDKLFVRILPNPGGLDY